MSYRAYKPLWQPMWISRQLVIATCMAQPTIAVRLPTSSTQAGLGNAIMEQTSQKTLQRPRGVTVTIISLHEDPLPLMVMKNHH